MRALRPRLLRWDGIRGALRPLCRAGGSGFLVALLGCGSPTAPSPPPVPAADLVSHGNLTFTTCLADLCSYQGEAVNNGAGCAVNVRGVTRLMNGDVQQAVDDWILTPAQRIRPQEVFLYGDRFVFRRDILYVQGGTYLTSISWDNTPC